MNRPKKHKNRSSRTPQELLEASGHLRYEIWMFVSTADALSLADLEDFNKNALLESFTMHARILTHVFFASSGRTDDVLAEDFISDMPAWIAARGPQPTELKISGRVGTEIAHASYGRLGISEAAKQWNITAIRDAMTKTVAVFAQHAQHLDAGWIRPVASAATTYQIASPVRAASNHMTMCNSPAVSGVPIITVLPSGTGDGSS